MEVSVVIPTFNRKDSLVRCLNVISKDIEVVVVDDGSSDGTDEAIGLINHPNLKYIRQSNKGPVAARNAGINVASGQYISFTDDDCIPDGQWPWPLVERMKLEGPTCGGMAEVFGHLTVASCHGTTHSTEFWSLRTRAPTS